MTAVLDRPLRWDDSIHGIDSVQLPSAEPRVHDHLPVVVFDGDDTLWATEHLYDDARRRAAKVVADFGIDPSRWDDVQRRRDVSNVARFGLSAERFPTSCVEAFIELAGDTGLTPSTDEIQAVRRAAESVFEARAPIAEHADLVLKAMRNSHRLVLLTQGDPRVQAKRVEDSGLGPLFDEIVVVATKSPAVLGAVVDHFGIAHDEAWMVGNSIPSDINPAIAAGMRAIWIDAHVWDHERREKTVESDRVVAASLAEVPKILSTWT
jgi:putative hydrolase of the HAD superfamily